mgnify:CR=1 FL=1
MHVQHGGNQHVFWGFETYDRVQAQLYSAEPMDDVNQLGSAVMGQVQQYTRAVVSVWEGAVSQMDYAVIQQGRLADKTKALSKEEALAAVRYGADKVFKSENVEVTDEDLDVILQSAKNLTAEREEWRREQEEMKGGS